MTTRTITSRIAKLLLLAGALTVAAAAPAAAGGWAATTLDAPPASLPAGQATRVGFTVRQHGVTPVNPDGGLVGISLQPATGAAAIFAAEPEGEPGHYVATVTVPEAGTYTWTALQGWFEPQPLGTIEVVPSAAAAAPGSGGGGSGPESWRVVAFAVAGLLAMAVVGQLALARRRPAAA